MDDRTGSADSENGSSDNSFVQVSKEDAQSMSSPDQPLHDSPQLLSGTGVSVEDDLQQQEGDSTITQDEAMQVSDANPFDPFHMESHDPEEEPTAEPEAPPMKSGGIEDVDRPIQAGSVSTTAYSSTELTAPQPEGFLSFLSFLHPAVLFVIYWRDPKISAVIFGVSLVVILTLSLNTFLHTIVLLLLSFLVVSLTYIVTKIGLDSFYNRDVRNPFSDYLSQKNGLPEEKIMEWTRYIIKELNCVLNVTVRLLLFDNIKQSLKFGIGLWLVSFVTNCITLMTALLWVTVLLFAVPPIYTKYQSKIDSTVQRVLARALEIFKMVKSRVPFLKKSKVE